MRVIIIGAGMSGVLAAIKLQEAGMTDIAVYEKGDSVGGTWRENRYPGLTCDLAAHAYTYSFERNPEWSQLFAPGPEIHDYFIRTAKKYDVEKFIRFNEEVNELIYDEGKWHVTTVNGTKDTADFVIAATGVLHHVRTPEIPGTTDFGGDMMHTARWDESMPLEGRNAAVIGNGSTGIQLVTALQRVANKVYQVQRTAQWVRMRPFNVYTEEDKQRFRDHPELIEDLAKEWLLGEGAKRWINGVVDAKSKEMAELEQQCFNDFENNVKDPELKERLRPDYRPGCKRLVGSWDYYDAVAQPNVEVVNGKIERIVKGGIRMEDGRVLEVDLIALATGFDTSMFLRPATVKGLDGYDLEDFWNPDPKAYLSITMPRFPNLFFLNGPNGPVGNFSLIEVGERQMNYIMHLFDALEQTGATAIQVTQDAYEKFDAVRREAARGTIWATGCSSWYLGSDGVPNVWPFKANFLLGSFSKPDFGAYEFLDGEGKVMDVDRSKLPDPPIIDMDS